MDIRRVYALALFLGSLGDTFGSAALADDARVHIVSPIEGQQFAPGDKVSIVVDVAPSLRATDGSSGLRDTRLFRWPTHALAGRLGRQDGSRAQSENHSSAADTAETA